MKRPTLLSLTAVVAAGAIAPTALGALGHDPRAATRVAVTAKEMKFGLRPTSTRAGTVTFSVRNTGRLRHDFKIAGKKTRVLRPRQTATLTVRLRKRTYAYLCTVQGHAQAGMKGRLRVR